MLAHYLSLALRNLRQGRVLTLLIFLAIGLGIGASMTMITVLHVMSGDRLPGRSGADWSARDDAARARVVVLNASLARRLFGDAPAVGRTVRPEDTDVRVVGLRAGWQPQPLFYASRGGHAFGDGDLFALQLQKALDLGRQINGNFSCWGNGGDDHRSDHCTWAQFRAELDSPAKARA